MRYSAFFLTAATLMANINAAEFSISHDGRVVNMTGSIIEGDSERFLHVVTPHSKLIQVQSGGGDTDEAMRLGRLIHDRGMDLEVDEFCASSCANYLFPAAINKLLPKGSMLGLHGTAQLTASASARELKQKIALAGIPEAELDKELPGFLQSFQKQALLERAYANYLGINLSFYTDYSHVIAASSHIQKKLASVHVEPLWWPGAARFEKCYGIAHVTDLSRPAELDADGYQLVTSHAFVFLGDIGLRPCR